MTQQPNDSKLRDKLAVLRGYESYADVTKAVESEMRRGYSATHHHLAKRMIDELAALPAEIAHKYFVTARQSTNDIAIDFAKKLIRPIFNDKRTYEVAIRDANGS